MNLFQLAETPLLRLSAVLALFSGSLVTGSAQFNPGNLVVLRLGDGTQTLTNSGNTVFLDQYRTNGELVNSVRLPDAGTTALILSGAAGSEGGLTRSLDRTMMAIGGYHTNRCTVKGSLSSQTGAAVPRAIATVDAAGVYNLVQTSKTVYSGNNIRCVATDGTNNFWTSGAPGGTCYFNPPSAALTNQSSISSTRYVKIVNENLYFSTQSGTPGIYSFEGGGLPQTSAVTNLLLATGTGSQPAGFDINGSLTLAYVADQRTAAGGGIQRWTNNGSGWKLAYTLEVGVGNGAFAVAVDFSTSAPTVYATTTEANSNRLVCIVDTNSSATATLVATAGQERTFKGLDFAPDLRPEILVALMIASSGSNVLISWPTVASGFILEANSDLTQPAGWSAVQALVVVTNGLNTVTLPAVNQMQFYRLKQ